MTNRWVHGALAGALALGLAGCTGGDGDDPQYEVSLTEVDSLGRPVTRSPGPAVVVDAVDQANLGVRSAPVRVAATIATGLTSPWGLAFLPDGSALVSERDTARIKRIAPSGKVSTVGTVPGVDHGGEGGLLGIAVGPDFSSDPQLYVYRTAEDGNEILRMSYAPTGLGEPKLLVDGIEKSGIHNGGRLVFGPDGMLYASTGDASDRPNSQDKGSLNGKILRMTPEGKPAPGNPFGTLVWSYGHRNVQGLAFEGFQLWASELGQNSFDELNRIKAGNNYGWPEVEGDEGGPEFTRPQRVWSTEDASPSGIAIAGGSVWMCALRGARLWEIPLTGDQGSPTGKPVAWFEGDYGRLRTVALAPDGSLWLITNNTDGRGRPKDGDDRILRITLS
jgi:glucose/arabinose dehydrogenase